MKAGYYTDKDGAEWLRLGKLATVTKLLPNAAGITRPTAVWSWSVVKERWGPLTLDETLEIN
jgi:hypothetical protein